ncbi:GntR family transcriptional regulator (plasmid) [Streptomyces sp. BI20]|uniref:GntR family transcriptional regulator n=1 Tax=Streptomyces sp. BI20 TaxID=3403460 RepID=UPI003C755349
MADGERAGRERPGGPASRAVLKRERVREHLLGLVEARGPGDPIPSERALCGELGVSRPTLRAAVDELVATGALVREHGRGMFVAPAKITQDLAAQRGPFAMGPFAMGQAGGEWSSRVLECVRVPAGPRRGRRLRVSPGAPLWYVARLRLVDGAPMAIEHLHVPADLVPSLTAAELEAGDLYGHLRSRHGVFVHEASQSIEPTVVSEAEAALLEVPVLSPALLIERLTTDRSGRPVEHVHSVYRGDRYRIVSRLSLGVPAGGSGAGAVPGPGGAPRAHHPGIPPGDLGRGEILRSTTLGDVHSEP